MAEGVPIGKRMVGVRSVFSGLHRVRVRRPLRRFAPLPLKGAAPCGAGVNPSGAPRQLPLKGKPTGGAVPHSIPQNPEVGHAEGLADEEIQRYHRVIRSAGDSCRGDAELF